MKADRQRRRKVIIAHFYLLGSHLHALDEAHAAVGTAFGFVFQAFDGSEVHI
jgi:hypothetical protein